MGWKAAQVAFKHWRILRGDKVVIIAGRDKGQQGVVQRVFRKKNRVCVEGLNLVKKHVKRTEDSPGGIITKEAPIHVSNVSLLNPATGAPCRVTFRYTEEGEKVRVVSGSDDLIIPRPEILKQRRKPRPEVDGPKDTPADHVRGKTFDPSLGKHDFPPIVFRNNRWEFVNPF